MHEFQPTILKRDATGRVHYRREQREALLDEFERSGLKGAAFVRTVGISYPTFANWIQQRRHARGDYRLKDTTAAAGARLPRAPRWIEATTAGGPVPGTPFAAALLGPGPLSGPVGAAPGSPLCVELSCGSRLLVGDARQPDLAVRIMQSLAPRVSC
jgi:hypothetical protein